MTHDQSIALLRQQLETATPTPETIELLKSVWTKLPADDRVELLELLGRPTSEEIPTWRTDDQLHMRLLRQWRWLAGISESLPEPWASAYVGLVGEFGEGDPDARRYAVHAQFGSASPLEADEIARLGPDAFVEWVAEWEPPPDRWSAPTPNGLATRLQEAVKERPGPWLDAFPALVERLHHPTYVRGVLGGVREAIGSPDLDIDWSKLLPAFQLVVSDPWSVEVLTDDPFDADRDWAESQREIMRLLESALEKDADLDADQLHIVWDLLVRLLEKGRDDPSHILSEDQDLVTLAINKDSTVALRTMFLLTLSASRRGKTEEDWGHQLASIIDDELNQGGDEARLAGAIAASLFPQFMHVSGDEALAFVPKLFGQPEPGSVSVDMLETLMKYARPLTNDLLALFHPYVAAYFRSVPAANGDAERSSVRWLVIGYIRHLPDQDDPIGLLQLLGEPSRISEAAEFYGRVLKQEAQGTPDELSAALGFWDVVLESDPAPEALRGFGWWSEGDGIPDAEWVKRIVATIRQAEGQVDWDHEVVVRLCRLAQEPDSWEGLALMVRGTDERWTVAYWAGDLQKLLEETSGAPEPIRTLRNDLVEALLERELLDFRRFFEVAPDDQAPSTS